MRALSRVVFALWLLIAAGIFLSLVHSFWPYTVDDSFITLRYGRNLLEGVGPVFNAGERAEGYTSFAWMLFGAAIHVLPFDAELLVKLSSLLATLVGVGVTAALAKAMIEARGTSARTDPQESSSDASLCAAVVGASFVLAYLGTAAHAVSGMETSLYTTACTTLFLWAVRFTDRLANADPADVARDPAYRRLSSLIAATSFVLGLIRPDGNLVALVTTAALWFQLPRVLRRDFLAKLALVYVLPGAIYFVWRWRYYGYFLPLPFYVKAEKVTRLAGAEEAWNFVVNIARGEIPILALAVLGAFWQRRRAAAPLLASLALFAFYVVPTPLMAYNYRYLHPIVPFLAALAGVGLAEARERARSYVRRAWATMAIDGGALAVFALLVPTNFLMSYEVNRADKRGYAEGLQRAHVSIARELAKAPRTAGASPTLAALDSGVLPYVSRWRAIDTFGLNDAHVARGGRGDVAYILDQRPDALILISTRSDRFEAVFPYESRLYDEALRRGYGVVDIKMFDPNYQLWVFAPHSQPIWK